MAIIIIIAIEKKGREEKERDAIAMIIYSIAIVSQQQQSLSDPSRYVSFCCLRASQPAGFFLYMLRPRWSLASLRKLELVRGEL